MLGLCIFITSTVLFGKSDAAYSALAGRVKTESGRETFGVEQTSGSLDPPTRVPAKMHHAIAFMFLMSAALALALLVKKCFGGIKSGENASSGRKLAYKRLKDDEDPCEGSSQGETPTTTEEVVKPKAVKPKEEKKETTLKVIEGVLYEVKKERKVAILDVPGDILTKEHITMRVAGQEWVISKRTVGEATPVSGHRRVGKGLTPRIINGVYYEVDEKNQCLIKEIKGKDMPVDTVTRTVDGKQYRYKYRPVGGDTPVSGHHIMGTGHTGTGHTGKKEAEGLLRAELHGIKYYVDEAKKIVYPQNNADVEPQPNEDGSVFRGPLLIKIALGGEWYHVHYSLPDDARIEGEEGFIKKTLTIKEGDDGKKYYVDEEQGLAFVELPETIRLDGKRYNVRTEIPRRYKIPGDESHSKES